MGVKCHPPPSPAGEEVLQPAEPTPPRHRSPARSPRAGGARSAAAVRASSSHGAAPSPGGASRPAAPALSGANCQGSKARVRRAPHGHHRPRAPAHVAFRVGRARPAPWGTLINQDCPFTPACTFADPSCTLTEAGIPEPSTPVHTPRTLGVSLGPVHTPRIPPCTL